MLQYVIHACLTFITCMQWRTSPGASEALKPVFIMLTDAHDNKDARTVFDKARPDGDHYQAVPALKAMMAEEAALPEDQQVTLHMLGFGPHIDEKYIERLANLGNGSYLTCRCERATSRERAVLLLRRILLVDILTEAADGILHSA